MRAKHAAKIEQKVRLAIQVVAIAIAGYLIISFVRGYMGAGAFVLPAGTTSTGGSSVCSTCAETGRLAPKCAGTCPKGQSCGLIVSGEKDLGTCQCVSK